MGECGCDVVSGLGCSEHGKIDTEDQLRELERDFNGLRVEVAGFFDDPKHWSLGGIQQDVQDRLSIVRGMGPDLVPEQFARWMRLERCYAKLDGALNPHLPEEIPIKEVNNAE